MNDYLWPREMESSLEKKLNRNSVHQDFTDTLLPQTSKSKSENSNMTSNTFADGNLPRTRQRNPFRRKDL